MAILVDHTSKRNLSLLGYVGLANNWVYTVPSCVFLFPGAPVKVPRRTLVLCLLPFLFSSVYGTKPLGLGKDAVLPGMDSCLPSVIREMLLESCQEKGQSDL